MEVESNELVAGGEGAFRSKVTGVLDEMHRMVIGKDALLLDMFVALFAGGHVMLEGLPGVAKTTIAKSFASVMGLDFRRVQFAPDILPSDITGACILNQKTMEFEIHKGPIFTNILLVDEINRASPKVQSALLEAMEEQQVSIDGVTLGLPGPFMVISTQNPVDIVGTFPLPESQIDRFMFKLNVDYPSFDEELNLLRFKTGGGPALAGHVLGKEDVACMMDTVKKVYIDDKVYKYILGIVMGSRAHKKLMLGASPRASISLLKASRALAALNGREYVIPDDVKYLAPRVMNHRLIVKPEYEEEGVSAKVIIDELLASVKVPA